MHGSAGPMRPMGPRTGGLVPPSLAGRLGGPPPDMGPGPRRQGPSLGPPPLLMGMDEGEYVGGGRPGGPMGLPGGPRFHVAPHERDIRGDPHGPDGGRLSGRGAPLFGHLGPNPSPAQLAEERRRREEQQEAARAHAAEADKRNEVCRYIL